MNRLLREERGGIFVLSAIVIPVFIVLAALVVDVGQWYTHKRQLQNRADAAAFAAGIEYAKNWKGCVQNGDPTLKTNTAREIANAARQYAANPDAAEYAPDPMPTTLHNQNIANQSELDVVINSTTYNDDSDPDTADPDSDFSDDYDGNGATRQGTPCFVHPADTISPGGGHWTDVRVKETDLPSLFGTMGLPISVLDHIGVPLSRNVARARIEIRPAISGRRFLPLAVPDNVILKVQVRYYDECRNTLLATRDLAEIPGPDSAAYSAAGGGGLWALPDPGDPDVGDESLSFPLTVPSYGGCGQDYLPIGVEVRIASSPTIDLNQTCAQLQAARYADCFHRLSQFRVYNDGNPESQPRLTHVRAIGGCGAPQDAYFSLLPPSATDCSYDISAEVNWGTRDNPPLNVASDFTVSANGTALSLVSWDVPNGTAIYASSGGAFTGNPGPNPISIELDWLHNNASHTWNGQVCRNPPGPADNPCQYNATQAAHQVFVGTEANAGAVGLVRTSVSSFVSGLPGPPLENVATGGTTGTPPSPISIYPTIGIRSTLRPGVFTILRNEDSQGSQLIDCDPAVSTGNSFDNFVTGCNPWYGVNHFNNHWWDTSATPDQCPGIGDWYTTGTAPAPFGKNSSANPWRCVNLNPGSKNGKTGDWMAVATKNCDPGDIGGNQCHDIKCNYDGNYDGKPGNPNGWLQQGGDSGYPRVVSLFIIPYQSMKGVSGGGETAPVIGFANFYVMDWTGANTNKSDQCPDTTWGAVNLPEPEKGTITGTFVEAVDYEPGPVDPNATCVEGQLIPCRVTLVR